MTSVAIFDYGAGNIFSLKTSLEKAGATVDVITNFDKPNGYSGLLLPGVGNFDPAVKSITESSKIKFKEYVKDGTPVLGICLGMEMFFEKSQEGKEKGLKIMNGEVIILPDSMKVPHMGWNDLEIKRPGKILQGVDNGAWVYFVHSYRVKPNSNDIITAEADYGIKVPAVVEQDNFFGTQFHPEKSGSVGKIMINNFLDVCKR
ncbi:imidazole glycerol phosphate synthase, glutamine amidotransferase subunit [Candidatus Nitrosopumilus salaria BD31]|uniref:Imidazole glycerol phosphate synthase subunit HisH n=1 Tax=Candidatus Nitrosopumilus salarius BD31 TaxID=859350 RepID=I3D1Q5_9ARCH|nr:imidazole glycerol phosphate synthase subunit HisH [Candidatus Nitrosopumilus salaria]EIJ65648.1 imidazole glycerol phosphate synthase, glutamine amidotransferase subunit [Candidatus Nitrosopumilus salaria BD31]